jgi:hypothetical protein
MNLGASPEPHPPQAAGYVSQKGIKGNKPFCAMDSAKYGPIKKWNQGACDNRFIVAHHCQLFSHFF